MGASSSSSAYPSDVEEPDQGYYPPSSQHPFEVAPNPSESDSDISSSSLSRSDSISDSSIESSRFSDSDSEGDVGYDTRSEEIALVCGFQKYMEVARELMPGENAVEVFNQALASFSQNPGICTTCPQFLNASQAEKSKLFNQNFQNLQEILRHLEEKPSQKFGIMFMCVSKQWFEDKNTIGAENILDNFLSSSSDTEDDSLCVHFIHFQISMEENKPMFRLMATIPNIIQDKLNASVSKTIEPKLESVFSKDPSGFSRMLQKPGEQVTCFKYTKETFQPILENLSNTGYILQKEMTVVSSL